MKTIILPTDYSDNANNAIEYALQMFNGEKVKFILFHSFIVPNAGSTSLLAIDDVIRKDAIKRLESQKEEIQSNYPKVEVETVVEHSTAVNGIENLAEDKKADLIIMGTQGASGLKEIFLGSNTVDVADSVNIPVWAIPEGVKYSGLDHVLFSSDYERINVDSTLAYLKELAIDKNSDLKVLHIKLDKDAPPQQNHIDVSHTEAEFFKPLEPNYRVVLSEDVEKGINWYLKKHPEINLHVVINHKRSFLASLFTKNRAHEIAYHSKLPILILPDNN